MKLAHTITISVFVRPGENEALIKEAALSLIPFDLEKEKITLKRTVAKANLSGQADIIIYEFILEKERHTNKFIEALKSRMGSQDLHDLAAQENRVDEECSFYMRLDKPKLLSGESVLTDSGDCFHIRMSLAAFPKSRKTAVALARKIFS